MDTVEEIQTAIGKLSPGEQNVIFDWVRWLSHDEPGELRVAETAAVYEVDLESPVLKDGPLTPEEYLALEEQALNRHEYVDGDIFAMSGGSIRHARVIGNVFDLLRAKLRGSPCEAFASGLKVRQESQDKATCYYPDVFVACGHRDVPGEERFLWVPRLVVEVLSASTERYDRVEKRERYQLFPSLEEYVLIAQRKPEVTLYRRSEGWQRVIVNSLEAVAEFRSIGFSLPLTQIYDGVHQEWSAK